MWRAHLTIAVLALTLTGSIARPAPAAALGVDTVCKGVGFFSKALGTGCTAVTKVGRVVGAGKKLVTGHIGGAFKTLTGAGATAAKTASTALALAAVAAWVLGGAQFALKETAKLISSSTDPRLGAAWFKSVYWRVAGIAALLTMPLLVAAAIQALMRSDLPMLVRSVFQYLPLSLLAVGVAAPLVTLALSATDEMSALVSAAAGSPGGGLLALAGGTAGIGSLVHQSLFMTFLIGAIVAGGAVVLWFELLIRDAAVYIVVLMLPLTFAAMVWPARRIWTTRALEVLTALIVSKFAIVAVLALGAEALSQGAPFAWLAGAALVVLGAFAPWAVLRFVPIAEVATGALAAVRGELRGGLHTIGGGSAVALAGAADPSGDIGEWAGNVPHNLRRDMESLPKGSPRGGEPGTEPVDSVALPPGDPSAAAPPADASAPPADASAPPADASASAAQQPEAAGAPIAGSTPEAGSSYTATQPAERLAGEHPMWQAGDLSWRPLTIGLGDGAPQLLWGPPAAQPGAPPPGPPSEGPR